MEIDKPFPELGASMDPKAVPWANAVVWSDRTVQGRRIYEWIGKEHVRGLNWQSGILSVSLKPESYLEKDVMYFLINAPFIAIGKDVTV